MVGGIIGGTFDSLGTRSIGNVAIEVFVASDAAGPKDTLSGPGLVTPRNGG